MEIEEILEEVKGIQEDINNAKQEKAKSEGILSEHLKTLKSLGVKSVVDGNKKVVILKKENEKSEKDIQDKFSVLQENYEW